MKFEGTSTYIATEDLKVAVEEWQAEKKRQINTLSAFLKNLPTPMEEAASSYTDDITNSVTETVAEIAN